MVGVATFGTAYLSLAPHPGPHPAMHAFTIITAAFALTALLAAAMVYRSTHRADALADHPAQPDAVTRHLHATAAGRA